MRLSFRITFYLLFLLVTKSDLFAQELPPIQIFSPEIYGADNQNWMISQGGDKIIYIANNDGLLEFNGVKWRLYSSPNNTIIRAVHVINDRVYTGSYMEFGYWTKDSYGELHYKSLIPKLNQKMVDDEHIWNIISYDEWVLFQSHNRIYFHNTVSEKFHSITSDNLISKIFKVDNTIYYHVMNEGVYVLEEGRQKLLMSNNEFKFDRVINIFKKNDELLILTRKNAFFVFNNKKIRPWITNASDVLKKMNFFSGIQLKDKSYVLGSISEGIVHLSGEGQILYHINQGNGLSNNTALSLFEDSDLNIWIGLDNGLNCLNLKSPIRIFNDDKGVLGTVYTSTVFNNYIYLGTNQGLFYKKRNSQEQFRLIDGTAGQVWNLFAYKNTLFCGHHLGTFIVKGEEIVMVSDKLGAWNFREVIGNEDILLQGNYDGLHVLSKENGDWKLRNKIKGFDFSARYFELNKRNQIFISHGYKGIFTLQIDENYNEVLDVRLDSSLLGKNSSLTKFRNMILYAYEKGIFKFDSTTQKFIIDSVLNPMVSEGGYLSGKLIVDPVENLWSFTKHNINYASIHDITNQYTIESVSIPSTLRKGMVGYESLSYLGGNSYLLGTATGYLTLDIDHFNSKTDHKISISSIQIKNSSNITAENIKIDTTGVIEFINNSITFEYNVPEYGKYVIGKYQYLLEGRQSDWSSWNSFTQTTFNNLPFGVYKFKVRAKIGNKITENIAEYPFTILRPWYFSNTTILIYFVVLMGASVLIHRGYKRYYKKQLDRKQLESNQLIIKLKNEKLNQEIENRDRELAISTMSIVKKNEVLAGIKKELRKIDHLDNIQIIKLIDKNINNTKDWEFFQAAFKNVDKDFLDKIKNKYAQLTPNDLRFCTYLRLNLSSKEIAPLLNMSIKSVETKRYRLRKKMGLMHEKSLVNHILEI